MKQNESTPLLPESLGKSLLSEIVSTAARSRSRKQVSACLSPRTARPFSSSKDNVCPSHMQLSTVCVCAHAHMWVCTEGTGQPGVSSSAVLFTSFESGPLLGLKPS